MKSNKNIKRKDVIKAYIKIILDNPSSAIWTKEDIYFDLALSQARGCYQRNVVRGAQSLSGSDLKGKAKRWSGRYTVSRDNLLSRIRSASIPFRIIGGTSKTGFKRLDIGAAA